MNKDIARKAHEVFSNQLLEDFIDEITGRNINRVVVMKLSDGPEEKFFVGKLLSINDDTSSNKSYSSKTYIQSMGVDFFIDESEINNAKLRIFPMGDFYYRVYPSLEEQRAYVMNKVYENTGLKFDNYDDLLTAYRANQTEFINTEIKLVPVFKKMPINNGDFFLEVEPSKIIDFTEGYGLIDEDSDINKLFQDHIDTLVDEISKQDDFYKYEVKEKISIPDLVDETSLKSFIINNSKTILINQHWELYIDISFKKMMDKYHVVSTLINKSKNGYNNSAKKTSNKITIETLFNSKLDIKLENAKYSKIEMDFFLDDYKYDRTQFAVGTNCSVEVKNEMIYTNHLPIFTQYRFVTNDNLAVKFDDLIGDPIATLKKISSQMDIEMKKWKQYKDKINGNLTEKGLISIQKEINDFELEIKRFNNGIEIINNYPIIKESFILMNKAFKNSNGDKYDTWRLFQIVFIVSIVPDIAACDENVLTDYEKKNTTLNNMSLLYFPTGGGKTEAFLGVLVFNLFFDRFRGKNAGVTSILRYTLRLLSVQQVQRLANILAAAELLRRGNSDISSSEEFSLGYFVGDSNTPNSITKKDAETKKDVEHYMKMSQYELDEDKIIDICPFCKKESVHIRFNSINHRLEHYCNNQSCCSGEKLPIYIVDNEIYRYMPSAIISTVDKLAIMGNNRNFRALITGADKKCPLHGYTTTERCIESTNANCKVEINDFEDVEMYDPAPTLLIQDELHLINESLGAYASHYESFLHDFITKTSNRGVKVIGATATISGYDMQVYHLYKKDPIRFPSASIYVDKNFYARTDTNDIQRKILGFSPYGKAIENSVVYSMKYMRTAVYKYLSNPQKVLEIPNIGISTEDEAKEILEDYWIFLEYNNVKRDSNNVEGALETPINIELTAEKVPTFIPEKMTGDETFQNVRTVLARVENTKNVFEDLNLIIATSMISHGVDADRFNVMFFYGMPGNIAEYIQAYSRTGRKYSSVVIDIMRPSRETDQSYLKNFVKMHEFKDILVDAVPINRWATKAIDHTIPGLFVATLLNYYDFKLQTSNGSLFYMCNIKKAINNNLIEKDKIKDSLYESYGIISDGYEDSLGAQYKEKIENFVDVIFEKIVDRTWREKAPDRESIFDGFKLMGYRIMNSMRDTDKQLIIELE